MITEDLEIGFGQDTRDEGGEEVDGEKVSGGKVEVGVGIGESEGDESTTGESKTVRGDEDSKDVARVDGDSGSDLKQQNK